MNIPLEFAEALHEEAVEIFNTDPAQRLEYATTITLQHCPPDLSASVRERFDEPFEQQHVCWELNTIQGPWAEHESQGRFRWLSVKSEDLDTVELGSDFLAMVYRHLVPA